MPFLFGSGAPARRPGFPLTSPHLPAAGFRWHRRTCPLHATSDYKM